MISVRNGVPAVVLAPMEGVTDAPVRALLTECGGFSHCVAEFLRVSQEIPPNRVYLRFVPELYHGGKTPAGVPVQAQLLGGDPEKLATAARLFCDLGIGGVDLNFGCPAPTVNRHDGGATLLKYPHRIRDIVEAVRRAVPAELPVSAKLRLGWDAPDPIHVNADMAAQGGASWITIHGRTKVAGYAPPALWEPIGEVRRRLGIPVIANGDIWSVEALLRCRDVTGCEHFMLGRGGVADPGLGARARAALVTGRVEAGVGPDDSPAQWLALVRRLAELTDSRPNFSGYLTRRFKQWVRMAALQRPIPWFEDIKRATTFEELTDTLAGLVRGDADQSWRTLYPLTTAPVVSVT